VANLSTFDKGYAYAETSAKNFSWIKHDSVPFSRIFHSRDDDESFTQLAQVAELVDALG
jgi:hypothetical protein